MIVELGFFCGTIHAPKSSVRQNVENF